MQFVLFSLLVLFFSSFDNKSYGTTAPDSPKIVYCLHGRLSKNCCNEQVLELTQIESEYTKRNILHAKIKHERFYNQFFLIEFSCEIFSFPSKDYCTFDDSKQWVEISIHGGYVLWNGAKNKIQIWFDSAQINYIRTRFTLSPSRMVEQK